MTLIPGTIYDPDIILGKGFVPNISWREPLSQFRQTPSSCGSSCIFFCSYVELPRLRTLAICQQDDLKRCLAAEIDRIKQWLTGAYAHEVSVEYTYWLYNAISPTLKASSINFSKFKFSELIPETLHPLARIFFQKYKPFSVPMSSIEIARRMGFKMDELWK